MGVVVRQSLKATIVSYVGAFFGYLNIMFITPYCLPPEIIGFTKIILDTGLFFTFLAQLGLNSAMIRFFPYFKDNNNNKGFFAFIVFIPLAGFVVLSGIVLLFQPNLVSLFTENSKLFADNFSYVLPLTFFLMYLGLLETYSSCLLRIVVPKIIRELILRFLNIAIIILFYFKILSFQQFILSLIAIHAIAVIINFFYLRTITSLSMKKDFNSVEPVIFKQFIYYILFIIFVGIGSNVVNKVDTFMISSSINLSSTGIFTIALYITTIIEIPARAFLQIVSPIIADSFRRNDIKSIGEVYKKSSLNQFIVGGLLMLIVWINVENIFNIMPNGEIYEAGKYVILFYGLGKLFDMVTGVNSVILMNSKYYLYQIFFILYLTFSTVFFNWLLIPTMGITGAGISSLISFCSYNLLMLGFLYHKMKILPFDFQTLKVLLVFIGLFIINLIVPFIYNAYSDAVIRSLLISGIFVGVVYYLKVSPEINTIINKLIKLDFKSTIS